VLVDPELIEIFRGYHARAKSGFVIESDCDPDNGAPIAAVACCALPPACRTAAAAGKKKNGKVLVGRLYRGRYQLEEDSKSIEVPLKVTDKQVALSKMERLVREAQQERYGIIPPRSLSAALTTPIAIHVKEFIAELQKLGRDERYVEQRESALSRLFAECGWKSLGEISPDQFLKWLRQHPAGAKTLNEYLSAANTFINWIKRSKRLSVENPLQHIETISTVGQQTYERRPFTDEELRRLMGVSAYRSVVYLTAAHTGLRRKELRTLVWADVFLDSPNPHVAVRAKNAKNRRLQPLPLHPEVLTALKKLEKERRPAPTDRVFYGIFPKRETFRNDLKRAGIQNSEDPSGKLHFHSLRHMLNHRLQENGVVPTVAQHLMRHSTITLTSKTYITSASLPLTEAIKRLPSILPGIKTDTPIDTPDTPIDTLKPVAMRHSVSQTDTSSQDEHDPKTLINKGSGRDLTLSVAQSHKTENGRGDRIRTCDLVVPNHALYQAKLRPEIFDPQRLAISF
jgi:integrase